MEWILIILIEKVYFLTITYKSLIPTETFHDHLYHPSTLPGPVPRGLHAPEGIISGESPVSGGVLGYDLPTETLTSHVRGSVSQNRRIKGKRGGNRV